MSTATMTRFGIDRTANHCIKRLLAAQQRGEDIHRGLIEFYSAFAREAAERCHLQCHAGSTLHPDTPGLADVAMHDQLEAIPKLNAEYFGRRDRGYDRECADAARRAFRDRMRELRAGWTA